MHTILLSHGLLGSRSCSRLSSAVVTLLLQLTPQRGEWGLNLKLSDQVSERFTTLRADTRLTAQRVKVLTLCLCALALRSTK